MKAKHLQVALTPPIFPQCTRPRGLLYPTKACQACWYYYLIAMRRKEKVGKGPETQIILEGELWMDTKHPEQKQGVSLLYGVTIEEMDNHWGDVIREAKRQHLPEPPESVILRPRIILH